MTTCRLLSILCQVSLSNPAQSSLQISQLLASITGEKAATSTITRPLNGIPSKRKAEDDAKGSAVKTSKTAPTSNGTANPSGNGPHAPRPYTGSSRPSSSNTPRPLSDRPAIPLPKKPSLAPGARPSPTSASFSGVARSAPAASLAKRSTPPTPTLSATADSTKAPKKGSIAEVRARAAAQLAKLQGIGKIQHKSTEKQMTKKEREEAAAEEAKAAKKALKPGTRPGAGGLPTRIGPPALQRNGNGAIGHLDRARGAIKKPEPARAGKAPLVEERKVKKAALATTGYQGSARPVAGKSKPSAVRPGAPGTARGPDRGRDKRPNPMGMFSKPRRQQDDDYDEDMDDFVVDDEEDDHQPTYANRYRYADEDDESDMEAGFSDVEDEESAAARAARLEDAREEKILAQRKAEKDERRKKALQNRR